MICIIASRYAHAKKWAASQMLSDDEWFCPQDVDELNAYQNFHVIVLENASELPPITFERLFRVAQIRGRINRE